ncbi:MAG: hypothetical protein K8F52_08050 [Candidatus Scalindua rubra]|uniref:Uncharacterized protein n=1 Tax=Candidatus Scalindua brodae TaxID=237368 RepID=A0A0B0EFB1_9BACT|nr:MAG: hypothetical protein SCABRO_02493 [Candidatus Scalindua brodae]MBZ0108609.1 hypothetical protein [Candidatus Scalindua rubra]TWU38177.1 hypothetical protein S225a_02240 [Candidatus Brocadiaceae bacterium S225]
METQYVKLKKILRQMFQMDQADLDFGIYRIMNQKREEIEQFLDEELLPISLDWKTTRTLLACPPCCLVRAKLFLDYCRK